MNAKVLISNCFFMEIDSENGACCGSKKYLHYVGSLFLLCLSAAILWQIFGPSWFKNIKAEVTSQPYAREITVTGDGKITAPPDIANIDLSVVTQGQTVKQVTLDGNQRMTKVVAAVKSLGVEDKDVVTSQYYLSPSYKYPNNGVATISGYTLTQQITVKVRKLDSVDDVLNNGISAGANQVGQLTFDIDDTSAVKQQARTKAFAAAKQKAQEMADLAGVKLSRVITFSETTDQQPVLYNNYSMTMKSEAAMAPAPTIESGSKEINLSVSVTYEIE